MSKSEKKRNRRFKVISLKAILTVLTDMQDKQTSGLLRHGLLRKKDY